ncbi:dihydroxyacetone kinase subunit DhaL [Sinorhizobium numidicum]|uniref:Dihydroxyacetone kinase subunit DhaL n=1 Tax=Sinorhizobium numidicum TaxID=680248 RepID=A0ABY8CWW7_9HYPH|nr:dihydroxyacetone kinase subunit DhaL [Sinorhizobium numidicum]WEX75449.1 dihydroxyacetone kinase subunit DhaL [Sinorhizobium numidicum]WEX81446.1 dihydroxyacetone kinase subunit DhaL [Sinorhizobium numidicum]
MSVLPAGEALIGGLIEACRAVITANADHLSELDRAIGDGDHGTNMRRGCEAVYAERDRLARLPLPKALEEIGLTLVMSVGGAAGPLYGTLLMEIGRRMAGTAQADFSQALEHAIEAVARRGRASAGDKTLLDVLYPVHAEVVRRAGLMGIAEQAERSAGLTFGMKAMRGRAAFLGERSIGHVDPGAKSCALLTTAICRFLKEQGPA